MKLALCIIICQYVCKCSLKGVLDKAFEDLNPDLLVLSDELFFDALTNPEYLTSKGLNLQAAFESYFKMRFYGILRQNKN